MACSVANWHEYQDINFTIKTNGSLINHDDNSVYHENEYCVDTMYNTDSRRLTDMVILCEFSSALFLKWSIVKVSVIITCICFAITIVLYIYYKKAQMLIIVGFCIVDLAFWIMYTMRIFYVDFGRLCIIFGNSAMKPLDFHTHVRKKIIIWKVHFHNCYIKVNIFVMYHICFFCKIDFVCSMIQLFIFLGYIYFFISLSRLSWLNILSCEIWIAVG